MFREGLAVVTALIGWGAMATVLNVLLRLASPDYAAVEKAMSFTFWMMLARLGLSAVASLGAGFIAISIARGHQRAAVLTGLILFALFAPLHYRLWFVFPIWYHLTFLSSLLLLTIIGALIKAPARA